MPTIEFRRHLVGIGARIDRLWRACRPRILVVTDSLGYSPTSGFGLSQFVDTLRAKPIHAMTPEVVTASRHGDPDATVSCPFRFDDPSHGLATLRYDVAFLFGIDAEGSGQLPQREIDAVARFMQDGGGLFATGDHESLGAALCRDLPRVRSMRFWRQCEAPNGSDATRLTTNLPGDDDVYLGKDQSDRRPQRLFANYRTAAGGVGAPHPLLQGGPLGAIEVFPDHPHEGECRLPQDLTTTYAFAGGPSVEEWPGATSGAGRVVPEMVALAMSHGNGLAGDPPFGTKQAVTPRAFMAVVAYDGQRAGVGRVVTDATWHHFVNLNLDGTGSPPELGLYGLQDPPGTDTPALLRVRQYYRNLAAWLLPREARRCLRFPKLYLELARYPLFEELRLPTLASARGEELREVGRQVVASLAGHRPRFEAEELVADALEDAVGDGERAELATLGNRFGRISGRDLGLAALGALAVAAAERLPEIGRMPEIDPHRALVPIASDAARLGVRRYVEESRKDLFDLDDLLHKVVQ
jgi:hypothetical protein